MIDTLGLRSINDFSLKMRYSNSSGVYNMINIQPEEPLSFTFIAKVTQVFPSVNMAYLKGTSDEVLNGMPLENYYLDFSENDSIEALKENLTEIGNFKNDEDLSLIFLMKLYKEQKKKNELLIKILNK